MRKNSGLAREITQFTAVIKGLRRDQLSAAELAALRAILQDLVDLVSRRGPRSKDHADEPPPTECA